MKKAVVFLIKWALVLLIFVWLFYRANQDNAFERLWACDKNGFYLTVGGILSTLGVLITFVRWQWLVQALGVPLSTAETMRLGFIGYVFNLSPMGIVGGDLVKGILLANKSPDAKAACAVSVIADRVIGLYAMFLLGLVAVVWTGFWRHTEPEAIFGTRAIFWLAVISTAGTIFLLLPESKKSWRKRFIRALPLAGRLFEQLFDAAAIYRSRWKTLVVSLAATFIVHILFALGLWCFALGLFGYAPSAGEHMVIYPIANCGSMIPLSAGPMEYFLDVLYRLFEIPGHDRCGAGFGMMVGLTYRVTTIIVAAAGGLYCLASRSEIKAALGQIKEGEREKSDRSRGDRA